MRDTIFGALLAGALGVGIGGCAGIPAASVPLERREADIEEAEVPPAALAALRERAGVRPLTEFEAEDRGGFTAFEGEWETADGEAEATVLADGALLEEEIELPRAAHGTLPPAVRDRVRELEAQGYDIEVARRVFYLYDLGLSRGGDDDGETDAEEQELLLRPDGTDATKRPR